MKLGLADNAERWLAGRGMLALPVALVLRALEGRLLFGSRLAVDWQLIVSAWVMAAIVFCGCLLGRRAGEPLGKALGALAWAAALTLLPPLFVWPWHPGTGPAWLLYASLALLAVALLYRAVRIRRWIRLLSGHGYEWILAWAAARPFYARLTAERVLAALGYYGRAEE